MPRASGKTTLLIKESAKSQKPIIVGNESEVRRIIDQANEMGQHIPEPINVFRYMNDWNYRHDKDRGMSKYDGLLIDELDYVLRQVFRKSIDKVTYTPKEMEEIYNMNKDNSVSIIFSQDGLTINRGVTNCCEDNSNLWRTALYSVCDASHKAKEGDATKMSKFIIGDVVRVKAADEMDKYILDDIKKLASTNAIISNVFNDDNGAFYFLAGHEGIYFNDMLLEDRIYTKDDIFNIHIIVPDKVVEIEFYDGKEKMVCHEDDVFDLRKCCFIAIAKHLYKKEYTQEGIEHMATQLTYQKKYVKIVDKALKEYKRKEEEKVEKIRKEEEERIVRARQSLKRRKQKERRAQRHKEVLVDLIADSINEAKKRRKRDKE